MITQLKSVMETVCLLSVTILIFKSLLHEISTAWETSEMYILFLPVINVKLRFQASAAVRTTSVLFSRSVDWYFVNDVFGQPVGPVFQGQAALLDEFEWQNFKRFSPMKHKSIYPVL